MVDKMSPYNSPDQLPLQTSSLPEDAKAIFMSAFNSSYRKVGEEESFKMAWGAVRNAGFVKSGDKWVKVSKASLSYWLSRFNQTEEHIGQLMSKDEKKQIMRQARAHAGGKARADSIKRKKQMEKDMIVTNLAKGDSRIGAIINATVHKEFTGAADDIAALGYLNTERRIALSSAIGDALKVLTDKMYEIGVYDISVSSNDVDTIIKSDADGLTSKESAHYRFGTEEENCYECEFFLGGSCELVSGYIFEDGVCDLFKPYESIEKNLTPGDVHSDSIMAESKKKKAKPKKEVAMGEYEKSITVPIVKADDDKRIVYGLVLEPYTIDSQEDWETPEDIEEAAHNFMGMWREQGTEHVTKNEAIFPIESYIAPLDMIWESPDGSEQFIKKGSWILGSKVNDYSVWQDVKAGILTGFSVEGGGVRDSSEQEMPDLWYMDGNVSIEKREQAIKERANLADVDFAGKDRTFPITKNADVMAALHSIGRASENNYSPDELSSNIIMIARSKGLQLPKSFEN